MKTHKNTPGTKKAQGNSFDKALIRLGQHFLPQKPMREMAVVAVGKKA